MTDVPIETRLIEAFRDARRTVEPNRDLFARVSRSIADAAARRRWRIRLALGLTTFVLLLGALALALSDVNNGRITMEWWTIELITNIVLVSIAIGLGPFIKRFGRAYAADVFRANPRTGKSFIVLTDIAYYLIFSSYIMFTTTFELPSDWDSVVNGAQLKSEVARVAGIALIIGLLHGANLPALPVIGRLLTLNRQLDERVGPQRPFPGDGPPA